MLTKEQIAALPGLVEKTSQAPWKCGVWKGLAWPERRWSVHTTDGVAVAISPRYADPDDLTDARLIALAPSLAATVIEQQRIIRSLMDDRAATNAIGNIAHAEADRDE